MCPLGALGSLPAAPRPIPLHAPKTVPAIPGPNLVLDPGPNPGKTGFPFNVYMVYIYNSKVVVSVFFVVFCFFKIRWG